MATWFPAETEPAGESKHPGGRESIEAMRKDKYMFKVGEDAFGILGGPKARPETSAVTCLGHPSCLPRPAPSI